MLFSRRFRLTSPLKFRTVTRPKVGRKFLANFPSINRGWKYIIFFFARSKNKPAIDLSSYEPRLNIVNIFEGVTIYFSLTTGRPVSEALMSNDKRNPRSIELLWHIGAFVRDEKDIFKKEKKKGVVVCAL